MQGPHDKEEDGVADGFVELAGMAGQLVDALEDECPGHVGGLADDFAVHEVAQTDEAGGGAGGDGDIVEHRPHLNLRMAAVEPQRQNESGGAAMRGQSGIACHLPATIGQEVDGQQHLDKALERRQKVVGLVEDAVAESGADENAEEAIEEERVEQLVLNLLLLVEPFHDEVGDGQADEPAQGVPAE